MENERKDIYDVVIMINGGAEVKRDKFEAPKMEPAEVRRQIKLAVPQRHGKGAVLSVITHKNDQIFRD